MKSFIDYFIIPIVALAVFYLRERRTLRLSLECLTHYGIFLACNIPLAHTLGLIWRVFTVQRILPESGTYTLLALLSAAAQPFLFEVLRKYFEVTFSAEAKQREQQ